MISDNLKFVRECTVTETTSAVVRQEHDHLLGMGTYMKELQMCLLTGSLIACPSYQTVLGYPARK